MCHYSAPEWGKASRFPAAASYSSDRGGPGAKGCHGGMSGPTKQEEHVTRYGLAFALYGHF
jgi:hypothetical protein